MSIIARIDKAIERLTDLVCNLLLLSTTLVILYSVVQRYIFSNPPFWSDIISTFGNVGVILLGLSLTVRNRDLIAMQALYESISPLLALLLDALWNLLILVFAVIFTWYGLDAALKVPGFYWELNMLPQKYPMMIVPVSGMLLVIACTGVLVQDVIRILYHRAGGTPESSRQGNPPRS